MLRHYGRLLIIAATIVLFFIIYSLNLLPTSPSSFDVSPESQLQGEELLGSKLGEVFTSKHNAAATPDEPATVKVEQKEQEPERETPDDARETLPENAFIRPEDPAIETDLQPPTDVQDEEERSNLLPLQFTESANEVEENGTAEPGQEDEAEEEEEEEEEVAGPLSKIIVVGQLRSEDTEWVRQEMSEWQNAIYYVDLPANETSPSGLRTKMNKAKEAMPYLTYIVDNYPNFPDVMAFIHAHRRGMPEAWHNDAPNYDAVHMLNALRVDTVLDRGYVNLRCNNEVGCPDEIQPWREPPDEEKHAEHAFPYIYANFFNASVVEMKEQIPVVATQCCAQFAVSKKQMLMKPKSEYERYLSFLEYTHYDDDVAGRVLEYMWHIIFGRDAVHCEDVFQCWCAVYGRCRQVGAIGLSRGGGVFGPERGG